VRTPILTTSFETWASAAGDANIAAASAPSMDIFLAEITGILPSPFGALAGLIDRELKLKPVYVLAVILQPRSNKWNGSGGEPDLTGRRRVVTGEFRGPLLQPVLPEEADQRLNLRAEITALPHQEIEILPDQRDEIEAG
jgi:hypothetical protein